MGPRRFRARVEGDDDSGGLYFEVPFDVRAVFGRARAPVRATVDGFEWRTTVAVYGGRFFVALNREVRAATGAAAGREIDVALELDEEPRTVEIPPDLAAALAREAELERLFDSLSYTHRKEYVLWIEEAKRPATRERRIERTLELLRAGTKTPR